MAPIAYSFCRETGDKSYRPVVGRGAAQQHHQWYHRPKSTGAVVKHIGEAYHFNYLRSERLELGEIDADYWKSWVHTRLTTPIDSQGAMTLFQAAPKEQHHPRKEWPRMATRPRFIFSRKTLSPTLFRGPLVAPTDLL